MVDPSLDPVEDFLVNRKRGHCEYFASALALLLRSIDIPARMVNGFKGGDWNELAQSMNVRQKHAHSWVPSLEDVRLKPYPLFYDYGWWIDFAELEGRIGPRTRAIVAGPSE